MSEIKPKIKKLYYSIGEVSKLTNLKAYVLRYWESEFNQLNPPKNRAGNRTYRQRDIDIIIKIKDLLYEKKYTIEGAKKTPLNGCVRNNDAFTAGRAVAHLTHALSQKVGGRCGDILGRSGDALAHSGDIPGRSMTLQDAPGRSGALQRRFGGH